MIALFKTFRKAFLPALILAGSSPFVLNHWVPDSGRAPMKFTLLIAPFSAHNGTGPLENSRHKICWKAEDNAARAPKVFIQADFLGTGRTLALLSGKIQVPPFANLSSRTPAVLSILRL